MPNSIPETICHCFNYTRSDIEQDVATAPSDLSGRHRVETGSQCSKHGISLAGHSTHATRIKTDKRSGRVQHR